LPRQKKEDRKRDARRRGSGGKKKIADIYMMSAIFKMSAAMLGLPARPAAAQGHLRREVGKLRRQRGAASVLHPGRHDNGGISATARQPEKGSRYLYDVSYL
jgi:hypothetical protein